VALRNVRERFLAAAVLGAAGVLLAVVLWPGSDATVREDAAAAAPEDGAAASGDAAPRRGTSDPDPDPGPDPARTRDPVDPVAVDSPQSPMGRAPPVRGDANPQVARVVEAATSGAHGERLHMFGKPTALSAEATAEEVRAWVATPEPGRALHPAPPGPDVPRLALEGPGDFELAQGATVTLRARAVAGAPVSFTAVAGGRFPNQLGTITVLADEAGIAATRFRATPGVVDEAPVIAASPRCSGRITFTCFIPDPAPPPDQRDQAAPAAETSQE